LLNTRTTQKINKLQYTIDLRLNKILQLGEQMDKYGQTNKRNIVLIYGIKADKDEVVNLANITNFMENVRKLEFKRENIVSAHKVDKSGNVMLVSFDSSNTKYRIFKVK